MICPVCHEEMMVVEYKKIELDICATCGGIWFDEDELHLLLGTLDLSLESLGQPIDKHGEKHRKCPFCQARMEKLSIGSSGVIIDACRRNHGLWFDRGEIDTVISDLGGTASVGGSGHKVRSFLAELLGGRGKDDRGTAKE